MAWAVFYLLLQEVQLLTAILGIHCLFWEVFFICSEKYLQNNLGYSFYFYFFSKEVFIAFEKFRIAFRCKLKKQPAFKMNLHRMGRSSRRKYLAQDLFLIYFRYSVGNTTMAHCLKMEFWVY